MIDRKATGALLPSVSPAVRLAVSSALRSIARPCTPDIDIRCWEGRIVDVFENFSHIDSPVYQPLPVQKRRSMLVRANRLASKLQESLAEVGEEFLPLSEAAQGIGQSLGSELARLSPKMTKPGTKRSLLAQAVADVAAEAYQALSGKRAGYQNDPYHRGAVRGQFPAFLQTVFDALKMEDSAGNSAKAAVRRMRAAGSSI